MMMGRATTKHKSEINSNVRDNLQEMLFKKKNKEGSSTAVKKVRICDEEKQLKIPKKDDNKVSDELRGVIGKKKKKKEEEEEEEEDSMTAKKGYFCNIMIPMMNSNSNNDTTKVKSCNHNNGSVSDELRGMLGKKKEVV